MELLKLKELEVVDFKENEHGYTIRVETKKCNDILCPDLKCSSSNTVKNGTKKNQFFWDIPINGEKVCFVIDRQRYMCKQCGATWLEKLNEIDDIRKMTKRLIEYIKEQTISKNRTFASVAAEVGVTEPTIKNVVNDAIREFENQVILKTPQWLGINEVNIIGSARTLITNIKDNTIMDILKHYQPQTIIDYLNKIPNKDKIEMIIMDTNDNYRVSAKSTIPNVKIVANKSSMIDIANECLLNVRKEIRKGLMSTQRKVLKNERYALLKRKCDLSSQEINSIETWSKLFPMLGESYNLKETFCSIWDIQNKEAAAELLESWVKSIPRELKVHFKPLTDIIESWYDEVLNYYDYNINEAYIELINLTINQIKEVDRGYSFDIIRAKILGI